LEKQAEMSIFDFKEKIQNKKIRSKTPPETYQKVVLQPKSREVFCQGITTTTGSNSRKQNSTTLMAIRHLNSTGSNQGGTEKPPPPPNTQQITQSLSL
jgi:hypothetical protein